MSKFNKFFAIDPAEETDEKINSWAIHQLSNMKNNSGVRKTVRLNSNFLLDNFSESLLDICNRWLSNSLILDAKLKKVNICDLSPYQGKYKLRTRYDKDPAIEGTYVFLKDYYEMSSGYVTFYFTKLDFLICLQYKRNETLLILEDMLSGN